MKCVHSSAAAPWTVFKTACCRSVVGFFGYDYDRKLALQALAVSAAKSDVHSVFAGYVVGSPRVFYRICDRKLSFGSLAGSP